MMSDLGAMLTASKVAGPSLQRAPVCEGHDESAHVVQLVAIVHLVVLAVREARREAEARGAHVSARDSQRRGGRGEGEVGEARHLLCCSGASES